MSATTEQTTGVFLDGDPNPIETSLTVEQVSTRILDAMELDRLGIAFVRVPTVAGDALIRPRAIVAILPRIEDDEDEDE